MKTSRIAAAAALVAAATLTLSGCIIAPPGPPTTTTTGTTDPGTTDPGTTEPGTTDPGTTDPGQTEEAANLADTSWTGTIPGVVRDAEFTLEADGTIFWTDWAGQEVDLPGDVWTQAGTTVSITVSEIFMDGDEDATFDITFTGPATSGSLALSGQGTDGSTYSMSANQG